MLSANTRWLCALLVVLKGHLVLLDWSCVNILQILQKLMPPSNMKSETQYNFSPPKKSNYLYLCNIMLQGGVVKNRNICQ